MLRRSCLTLVILFLTFSPAFAGPGPRVGDVNGDGRFDLADAIGLLKHLFTGPPVSCPQDVTGDGFIDLSDAIFLLNFIFFDGNRCGPGWSRER